MDQALSALRSKKRRDLVTVVLYARAVLRQFRTTLVILGAAVVLGGALHWLLGDPRPSTMVTSYYDAWMAILGENVVSPTDPWVLVLLFGTYPLVGFVVIGEGIVRLALLVSSKQHSEREWTKVKASTYRDHVILCGVGHLGFRVVQELVAGHVPVIAIEKDPEARFLAQARVMGIPILVRDMKDDEALREAGVEHARAIVVATNDDMANLEVALDARRMNPGIRILMRLFDQQIAAKISQPLSVDVAFSSSALAAPIVAAMTVGARVLASFGVAGVPHVTAEVTAAGKLAGRALSDLENRHGVRVLARGRPPEMRDTAVAGQEPVAAGEVLVVYGSAARVGAMAADAGA